MRSARAAVDWLAAIVENISAPTIARDGCLIGYAFAGSAVNDGAAVIRDRTALPVARDTVCIRLAPAGATVDDLATSVGNLTAFVATSFLPLFGTTAFLAINCLAAVVTDLAAFSLADLPSGVRFAMVVLKWSLITMGIGGASRLPSHHQGGGADYSAQE
jgi:hypothetical protein